MNRNETGQLLMGTTSRFAPARFIRQANTRSGLTPCQGQARIAPAAGTVQRAPRRGASSRKTTRPSDRRLTRSLASGGRHDEHGVGLAEWPLWRFYISCVTESLKNAPRAVATKIGR